MTSVSNADGAVAFSGAVLCGGASTRMGTDKALLEVAGEAMARRVADALWAAGATEVLAIGGDGASLRALGLSTRPDGHAGAGPLAATVTALEQSTPGLVLVVACDLLHPHPASMTRTIEALHEQPDALGAIPALDGHRQWTHAAWRTRAAEPLGAAFAAGIRSVHQAAASLPLVVVRGLNADAMSDADTPQDLTES